MTDFYSTLVDRALNRIYGEELGPEQPKDTTIGGLGGRPMSELEGTTTAADAAEPEMPIATDAVLNAVNKMKDYTTKPLANITYVPLKAASKEASLRRNTMLDLLLAGEEEGALPDGFAKMYDYGEVEFSALDYLDKLKSDYDTKTEATIDVPVQDKRVMDTVDPQFPMPTSTREPQYVSLEDAPDADIVLDEPTQIETEGLGSRPVVEAQTDDDMGLPDTRSTEEQSVAAEQYLNENLYSTDAPINVSNMQISGTNFSDRNNAIDEVARGLSNTYTDEEVAALKATISRESGTSLVERGYTKEQAIEKFPNYATELARLPDDASGDAIFDVVYGRENMGNTEAGDGSKYKGRGLIQITGKNNYRDISERLGLGDLLVTNPELVATDPAIMVAATKAYLDMKGFGSNALSANSLKDTIGHGGGATEAETRWANTIEDLRNQGKDDLADELELNNEFAAQRKVGTTVDGDIGPNSRDAFARWLTDAGISFANATSDLDLVRLVNSN
jgi:predicted chitinase